MAIKSYKPTTPSRRTMTVSTFEEITKKTPEKSLLTVLKKNAGRNSYGKITVRHKGGGNRRKYRIIDFKRNRLDEQANVIAIEYDPNRSANIALIEYSDGVRNYIIAPEGLNVGDTVELSLYRKDSRRYFYSQHRALSRQRRSARPLRRYRRSAHG